jgi:hypothetical protein
MLLASAGPLSLTPHGISRDWNSFFDFWVRPAVHFGTPVLVVFAVLLVLARALTRLLMFGDPPGPRSASTWTQVRLGGVYWLGVGCLLWPAIGAVLLIPLGRPAAPVPAPTATWAAGVSIGLIATAVAVAVLLYGVVGWRYSWQGFSQKWMAGVAVTAGAAVGLILGIGLAGASWHYPWLNGQAGRVVFAIILAVAGIAIVGRARGIGMGLLIQGHDKTGGDDAGLGASIRARLYTLGTTGPAGIQVTQQTDVSTLRGDALGLIPEGALAKLATLFLALFTPSTPWRVDVTEQADSSIVVSVRRNGAVTSSAVIRPSTLWLPDQRTSDPAAADTEADWTRELRTAAAACVLLTLSERYAHLRAGLSRATDWRSVALQVIATDPTSHLDMQVKRDLLVRAVTEDGDNMAARLALLFMSYRSGADKEETRGFIGKLTEMLACLTDTADEGLRPLAMRVRFNLMIAQCNYAAFLPRDVPAARWERNALRSAARHANMIVAFLRVPRNQKRYPELCQELGAAVIYALEAIDAEWRRRSRRMSPVGEVSAEDRRLMKATVTLQARYEHACALVARAATGVDSARHYGAALDELEMAIADHTIRAWAPTDPSMAELHDIDRVRVILGGSGTAPLPAAYRYVARFKGLIGQALPGVFLDLAVFAAHKDVLDRCGIHTAAQFCELQRAEIIAELGATVGEAARLIEIARLYELLYDASAVSGQAAITGGADMRAAAMTFLLLEARLDRLADLRGALASPVELKERLIETARGWAVAAPGEQEILGWRRELQTRDYLARMRAGWFAICRDMIPAPARPRR